MASGSAGPLNQVDFLAPSTGRVVQRLSIPGSVRAAAPPFRPGYDWGTAANNFAFASGGRRLAVAVYGYVLQWALPQG